MKRFLIYLALALLVPVSVMAQATAVGLMGNGFSPEQARYLVANGISTSVLANGTYIQSANATPAGANVKLLGLDSSNNTNLGAFTGKVINLQVGATPTVVAKLAGDGLAFQGGGFQPYYPASAIITPATNLTPVAGARIANQKVGMVATAAPTAVYVFAQPTLSQGKSFSVYNQGASPAQILPESGTINEAAALTPYACAAKKWCECYGASTSLMLCNSK